MGRVYDFGHECFPISITANGNELLEKPVSLVGEAYGESIVWKDKESFVLAQTERKVQICTAMQSELVVISTVVEVEYDGYMKFSIRLSPTGTSVREGFDVKADCMKRHIDKLWLEIPLKSNIAKFVHNSGWPIGAKSEELKENKSQLFPVNWYGNDECGLGIYFESDQNWRSFKREEAVECIFCDDNRILRYHLLDSAPKCWEKEDTLRPTSDARGTERTPVFFEFALQATPIKKFDETQVRNHIVHIDCFEKIYIPYSDFLMGKVNDTDDTNIR